MILMAYMAGFMTHDTSRAVRNNRGPVYPVIRRPSTPNVTVITIRDEEQDRSVIRRRSEKAL